MRHSSLSVLQRDTQLPNKGTAAKVSGADSDGPETQRRIQNGFCSKLPLTAQTSGLMDSSRPVLQRLSVQDWPPEEGLEDVIEKCEWMGRMGLRDKA
jgi:hypothetical protein